MKNRNITFTTIVLALGCLALSPTAKALLPAPSPDGGYPGGNTAEGINALHDVNTAVGINNTAVGANALTHDTTGFYNVAVGNAALASNTTGNFNMAIGTEALRENNANFNLAIGFRVLFMNTTGNHLTGIGAAALRNNTTASFNTAIGADALRNNTIGEQNTAIGANALVHNDTGSENNAFGTLAMELNTSGSSNTAIGDDALRNNVDGSGNVAVGDEAGTGLGQSVSNCIAIGAPGDGPFAILNNTCFIGSIYGQQVSDPATQVPVYVDQFNNVGVFQSSSRRIKHDIQPMDKASETLYRLKPVTFKFNSDWKGTTQHGLIAEEVAEVDPQLVVHGKNGEVTAVRYEQINNMLLNEFLKEHKKMQGLEATVAQQQKGMEVLTAQLKEQAAQIQKVSAQLEVSKTAPRTVANE